MTITIITISVVVWVCCGVWASGRTFAYFQDEYPELAKEYYKSDLMNARLVILFGPFVVPAILLICRPSHGWRWK
jgi:hypothetical protein